MAVRSCAVVREAKRGPAGPFRTARSGSRAGESGGRVTTEGPFQSCGRCQGALHAGTPAVRCPTCGALYHEACYRNFGCSSPSCLQGQGAGPQHDGGAVAPQPADLKSQALSRRAGESHADTTWLLGALGVLLILALLGALGWYFLGPAAAARRAYVAGTYSLADGDTAEARAKLQTALRLRPDMAEAHLSLGFAHLEFRADHFDEDDVEALFDKARWGQTAELDSADAEFDRCIEGARKRPPNAPVRAIAAATNAELISVAWIGKAMTALVRSTAAYDTGHSRDGRAWVAVALRALDEADRSHPSDDTEDLRELAGDLERRHRG